jgi:hypothetical protein
MGRAKSAPFAARFGVNFCERALEPIGHFVHLALRLGRGRVEGPSCNRAALAIGVSWRCRMSGGEVEK